MDTSSKVVGYSSTLLVKNKVKFEVQVFDVSCLVELIPKIPQDVKDQFAKDYGRLIDLLLIPVDVTAQNAMGTMAKYWNPSLRVFEFPNIDASPTIEEYEVLLDITPFSRLKVYLFTGTHDITEVLIEELIGVRPTTSNIIKQGPYSGLKWSFLKKHIDQMVGKGDWDLFKPAFALAIYGKVLFPFVNDMVDQCAIDVLTKFKKFGANPVPAILADTLLALQRSIEKGIPKIRCCAQLLYVWMITRFKHHQYPDWSRYPLRRFRKTKIQPMQLSNWETLFNEVTPRNFGTKCNMYDKHEEVMYSCKGYPNMILMGPRGCITFTPALVLGQMKWGMVPVPQEQLQRFVVWYKNKETTKETLDAVRNALRNIRVVGKNELGEHRVFYTDEYKSWRNERRKRKTIPLVSPPQEPSGPSDNELLRGQIKLLEAKLEEARDKREKEDLNREKLNKALVNIREEHISLKRDYAQMCYTSEKYYLLRCVKEKDALLADYAEQLKAQRHATRNAQAKAKTLEQEMKRLQKNEKQAWTTVNEYQMALDEGQKREDHLKTSLENTEKTCYDALTESSQLSEQLWKLRAAHDELIASQEHWSDNWNRVLEECRWEKDKWEGRCGQIINGLGDFSDDWLRMFLEASQEMKMYPETELLPTMKAFFDTCIGVARQLKKWKDEATKEF
ncbi:hypothetical protein Lal_00039726 [Lupinus albus]|nr:hypothetical protein Lal_00039726 [Lupinus albus]